MNPASIDSKTISEKGKVLMEEIIRKKEESERITNFQTIEDTLNAMICTLKFAETQLERLHGAAFPRNYEDPRNLSTILEDRPVFDGSKMSLAYSPTQLFPDHASLCHNGLLSTIEFSKLLDFFPKLNPSTRKKLMMNGALSACSLTNSYYSIQKFNSDIIRRQDGTIAGKPMRNYNGIWMDHREILQKSLHAYLRNRLDQVEYMFLKAIVLCDPATPDLPPGDQKIIEAQRMEYAKNLLQYCLKQHGQLHGPDRFGAVLSVIPVMESQKKGMKSFGFVLRYFYPTAVTIVSPLYDELCEN